MHHMYTTVRCFVFAFRNALAKAFGIEPRQATNDPNVQQVDQGRANVDNNLHMVDRGEISTISVNNA